MGYGNKLQRLVYDHSPAPVRDLMVTVFSRGRGRVKFGPRFHEYLADLDRTQWLRPEEWQARQDEKLRALVHHVSCFVPYYENLFRERAISPESIRTPADLVRLPLLDKPTVQEHAADLRSRLHADDRLVERFQTSGTTGRPIEVVVSRDCLQLEKAFTWHHRRWGGIEVGDRTAAFVGFPVVPLRQRRPPFWVHDRSEGRVMYSLQHMNAANLPAYAASLASVQPAMIYGYPTAIYLMAQHLNDTRVATVRPKAVFTASETLLPHQRAAIERAFGCLVFDWYGATELVANIVQCERGNYHVKPEYGVVEILRPDGTPAVPGESGEMVCTGLNNLAMPFIRYRVGDMAVPRAGECPCGRAGALIEGVTGRVEDVIVTPDGRWLSRLDFVFKGQDRIEEAQLVQDDPRRLLVRVVKRPGYTDADERRVLANLRERMGDDMTIAFAYLDHIPRTRSGKFRYVVSTVALGLGSARQTGELLDPADSDVPPA
jgi:phenylacetate-CoA ligase